MRLTTAGLKEINSYNDDESLKSLITDDLVNAEIIDEDDSIENLILNRIEDPIGTNPNVTAVVWFDAETENGETIEDAVCFPVDEDGCIVWR